ncbi:hypothetical protein [Streptomyces omiyaensis]|uniref:hypothetical protein n=1 Tax=Streptomyces omiyaensis TaxID=68247 RepID=UPI0036F73E37
MAKGGSQIPTGPDAPANGSAEKGGGGGRNVLPPLTGYPPNVTRDTEGAVDPAEETGGEDALPAVVIPTAVTEGLPSVIHQALVAELPEAGTRGEIITACERRLHAAQTLREAMEQRALTAYFHYAGPAVRLANSSESWRDITDPSTGKPCRSWSAWLRIVKVSRQHAFRMVKEEPLMEALTGLNVGALGVRQIDVLSPVLTTHGKDQVRLVWTTAAETGDTNAPALEKVRAQLGLAVSAGAEDDDQGRSSSSPVLRFQATPGTFDESRVREVARSQPEVSLLVARTILSELQVDGAE